MRLQINDTEVVIPSSLAEFTLGQRIDFHRQYGEELERMAGDIAEMEDGPEKEIELMHFHFEQMFRTFAFFANTTPEALKESAFIDDIANIYHAHLATLFAEEKDITLKEEYLWNGEVWHLHAPQLMQGSKITFGQFIDSKQLIQDTIELGKGKWEYLPKICAIYLTKAGEEYSEEFLYEGSERVELMRSLPMDIALAVGFFLSSSLNTCISTFQSSSLRASRGEANTARSISHAGDGSTS